MGYQNIHIELDSKMVVKWLHKNLCSTWYLWNFLECLEETIWRLDYVIKHQSKDGNQVVDYLPRQGECDIMKIYMEDKDIQRKLRGILRLD